MHSSTADRVEATARMLMVAAHELGMVVSGDQRASEADVATLLGYSLAHLRLLRGEGKGPVPYGRGMNGCRVSYRVLDVAEWIEAGRGFAS